MLFIIGFIDCCCIWSFTGKNIISAFTRQGSLVRTQQRPPIKTMGYGLYRSPFCLCEHHVYEFLLRQLGKYREPWQKGIRVTKSVWRKSVPSARPSAKGLVSNVNGAKARMICEYGIMHLICHHLWIRWRSCASNAGVGLMAEKPPRMNSGRSATPCGVIFLQLRKVRPR